MALDSYANLQTAVTTWLARSDVIAAQVQEFIRLAEEQMTADLSQCAFMQVTPSPIALSGSSFTLPATANSLMSVRLVEHDKMLNIVGAGELKRGSFDVTSAPTDCAITGATDAGLLTVVVWPDPDTAYTVQVTYTQAVPPLSDSRTSNFVLVRAPSLYLYGALVAASLFAFDDRRGLLWQSMYDRALEQFRGLGWDGDAMLTTGLPMTGVPGFDINAG